ncbi:phosphoribosylanthranilate isomerase [Halodesulfovibrio sp.]|uniref:phosphoribosylanthranilate isomerase n=1 Tax=Halodesulfovibrio sp. TaxID=1912772 RepID=UPI0025C68E0E|nr:phosphoribosylanthranilate isomerase [Halodesulfovibrio sp.]
MAHKESFVKVCGITTQQDADLCMKLGADLIGFIFDEKSPRAMTVEKVKAIETEDVMRVGVFTHHDVDEVRLIMQRAKLHLAQLHGDQDTAFAARVGKSKVMKVFWPARYETREELEAEMKKFVDCSRFFLMDAGTSGGGHGKTQNWSFLNGLRGYKSWFVAGGIGPENVTEVLQGCAPCGIDINSGVESEPGKKDPDKLRAVMEALTAPILP